MTNPSTESVAATSGTEDDFLLDVRNLKVNFPVKSGSFIPRRIGEIKAVNDASFTVRRGETLGLVGES